MEPTARSDLNILITNVGSYLGSCLARHFLQKGHAIYAVGEVNPPEDLLGNRNFTFAQLDLAQPFPPHMPKFDIILNLAPEITTDTFGNTTSLPPQTINLINVAKQEETTVIFLVPIGANTRLFERFEQDQHLKEKLKFLLVGNVYGPDMPTANLENKQHSPKDYFSGDNELANLITQAVVKDKVILENEGMEMVYPTHIDDAKTAIEKFATSKDHKNIRFIVSQPGVRSLSIAYEIQTAARNVLSKELGLFFSGPQKEVKEKTQPLIRISDLGYTPKVNLAQGLKSTLQSFKQRDLVAFEEQPLYESVESEPQSKAIEEKKQEISKSHLQRTSRLPKIKKKLNFKKIGVGLLVVLILSFAKISLDIYLGYQNATAAKNDLMAGNFDSAQQKAQSSSNWFGSAYNETSLLAYPIKFVIRNRVNSITDILIASSKSAQALSFFARGTKVYTGDIKSIINTSFVDNNLDFDTPTAAYQSAYVLSSEASELIDSSSAKLITNRLTGTLESLNSLTKLSQSALELTSFTSDLVGQEGKKTYLVLLENNTELRPGGGFIGNYALVNFDNGKFQNVTVDDVYNVDGQLKEKIDPPFQITEKLGTKQFYLRDSNWSTDFLLNAATAKDLFKKETGQDVNGVVSLDLTYVQWLLDKIGPVKVPDYKETITAQNLFDRGEYHAEVGFFPGSTQKKDFFSTLTGNLFQTITSRLTSKASINNPAPWTGIIGVTKDALAQGHLMLSFDDPSLASFVKTRGWDHPLPPTLYDPTDDSKGTRDFLALSEANLGANKVNRFLERSVNYEMTIGKDADLVAKLSITYKNNSQANTWPAGDYVNYLRVYVPFSSSLFAVQNGDDTDIKKVDVSTQNNLTVFATYVDVPIKSSKTITFSYRIPKNIKLEQAPSYNLYVQKQPGTENDPFMLHFNLPGYLIVKSVNGKDTKQNKQNLEINTNLGTDRQFEIDVAQK